MAEEKSKALFFVLLRYLCLFILAFIFTTIFYNFFLKLTIYPTNLFLNIFYNSEILGNFIILQSKAIEIIPACVAVSAYLLLLIFNLTTPMPPIKRVKSLIFSFASLLLINILRILFLAILFVNDYGYFEEIHKLFWYFLSTIFVVGIWFASVGIFKIKAIPVYTDFKTLISSIKLKNTKQK